MKEALKNGIVSSTRKLLSRNGIHISSETSEKLDVKLNRLVKDGSSRLQVLVDFDYTLSKYCCADGSRAASTHALFETKDGKTAELLKKYLAIEYDRALTVQQKIPHMIQWWTESHNLIVADGYTKAALQELVRNTKKLQMRDGFAELFHLLEKYDVPMIIFSGGIGDIIAIILHQNLQKLPPNVHIISNWMIFDENEKVIGFKDPIVHSFNKNSSVIKEEEKAFFEKLHLRPNVLLLGDSLGDAQMDVGLETEQTVLKIGFLNNSVDKFLDDYMKTFDVVSVQDNSLDVPLTVLKAILCPE